MESKEKDTESHICVNGVCVCSNESIDDLCVTDCDLEDIHPDDLDE